MPKKKRTNETDFEVSMVDQDSGGQPSKTTKTVKAPNNTEALRKATQGDPRAGEYEEITVKGATTKKAPGIKSTEPAKPAGVAETRGSKSKAKKSRSKKSRSKKSKPAIDPNTMEMIEGISYPYALMLPGAFRDFISSVLGESMEIRYGKVYAKIRDAETMKRFVEGILNSKDPKAKIVREGIMESLS